MGIRFPSCVFLFVPALEGGLFANVCPLCGIPEDSATGNSMGPLASFMMRNGLTCGPAVRASSASGVQGWAAIASCMFPSAGENGVGDIPGRPEKRRARAAIVPRVRVFGEPGDRFGLLDLR